MVYRFFGHSNKDEKMPTVSFYPEASRSILTIGNIKLLYQPIIKVEKLR